MRQDFSAPALIELAHRYYPTHLLSVDDPRHALSEENQRLTALREAEATNNKWTAFVRQMKSEFPESNVWDLPYLTYSAGHYCRLSLPGAALMEGVGEVKELVCMLSILAPVYCIFGSYQRHETRGMVWNELHFPPLPPEYQALETRLTRLIESHFGCTRLPNEVLFTPVPDLTVEHRKLGEARLIDCLFTTNRW